jgi:hypothetical protein
MATNKINDATAAVAAAKDDGVMLEPTVRIILPLAEDQGSDVAIDQTETVIINGKVTQIRRGEYVDVKVPVFLQLKQRYPNI